VRAAARGGARPSARRRRRSSPARAGRRRRRAAARPGVLGGPRARGIGARGGAGRAGVVRGRRVVRSAAARRRFDGGGRGFRRGKARGARGGCCGAHRGFVLGGERPEVEARRRGAELGEDSNGGRRSELDFGRVWARPRSWVVGVGGRRGCAARGATNRSGVARVGRRDDERRPARRARVRSVRSRREEGERGTGSFEGARDDKSGARTTRIVGMDDAWSRSPAFSRRYGRGRAQCRAVALFTRLKDFSSSLTS